MLGAERTLRYTEPGTLLERWVGSDGPQYRADSAAFESPLDVTAPLSCCCVWLLDGRAWDEVPPAKTLV